MTLRLRRSSLLRHGALLLSCLPLGCLPPPEIVGGGLPTDGSEGTSIGDTSIGDTTDTTLGSADSSSSDGTPSDDSGGPIELTGSEWDLQFEPRVACEAIAPMPDGGAVIAVMSFDTHEGAVRRYDADGTLLWQRADGTRAEVVNALPDGRIVAGGMSSTDPPYRAALWVLSPEGDVQATYAPPSPPTPTDDTWIEDLAADSSSVAFVLQTQHFDGPVGDTTPPQGFKLGFAGLDLQPTWWATDFDAPWPNNSYAIVDLQRMASGSVRTIEGWAGVRTRQLSITGAVESVSGFPNDQSSQWLAAGDPGVVIEEIVESYYVPPFGFHLWGLEELPGLDITIPASDLGLDPPWVQVPGVHHHDGLLFVHSMENKTIMWVTKLDEDGAPLYQGVLDNELGGHFDTREVTQGVDRSFFVCGTRNEADGTGMRGFLLRRFPRW